jgi:hypothetical protein
MMTLAEALEQWNSDTIKKYVLLLGGGGITRKGDRIAYIESQLLDKKQLTAVWRQLDPVAQRAVSTAFHNGGQFDEDAFVAQYGEMPPRPEDKRRYYSYSNREPILFDLFVVGGHIPADLLPLLTDLILPPDRFQLEGVAEIPETVQRYGFNLNLLQACTELAGRADLLTYLQLVEQGGLKWSPKLNELTAASIRKVMANLIDGDFFPEPDQVTGRYVVRPFALDIFTQEAGLVTRTGKLTGPGRKFSQTQDADIFLQGFEKWVEKGKFDELTRIRELNGLNSRGTRLTPAASRREKVIEALSWCPTHTWIGITDFYRALKIWLFDFEVETTQWSNLYVGPYKDYGYMDSDDYWKIVHGLYINAVIMEYLGTIGAVDVAYVAEDVSFVDTEVDYMDESYSLHDGLLYFRINNWGAFLLGQADEYVPAAPRKRDLFTIDEERVVHLLEELRPNEQLQLEAIAELASPKRYRLDGEKLLTAVESGLSLDQLINFLQANQRGELPAAVADWLDQLTHNIGRFREGETAVIIHLDKAELTAVIEQDKALSKLCQPLRETAVLVLSKDLNKFRQRLKALGYLLNPGKS